MAYVKRVRALRIWLYLTLCPTENNIRPFNTCVRFGYKILNRNAVGAGGKSLSFDYTQQAANIQYRLSADLSVVALAKMEASTKAEASSIS
ncbi:hypothetical protein ES703_44771 [subsurface metagenome]